MSLKCALITRGIDDVSPMASDGRRVCWRDVRLVLPSLARAGPDSPGHACVAAHEVTTLKVDIDRSPGYPARVWRQLTFLVHLLGWRVKTYGSWRSPSGTGWHVVVILADTLTPTEVVAVQALLGSDPRREAFNLARARKLPTLRPWRDRFNVLYDEKGVRRGTVA